MLEVAIFPQRDSSAANSGKNPIVLYYEMYARS